MVAAAVELAGRHAGALGAVLTVGPDVAVGESYESAVATQPVGALDDATPGTLMLYTSGTTGRPKGAVHVHGGFPIKGAQDLAHSFDLRPHQTLFWFTDLGWMMGPWAISGSLLLGASLQDRKKNAKGKERDEYLVLSRKAQVKVAASECLACVREILSRPRPA